MRPTPVTDRDHIEGPADATVTLLEYGDFECPFCVRAFPVIEKVRAEHPKCRFVFRHVARSSSLVAHLAALLSLHSLIVFQSLL